MSTAALIVKVAESVGILRKKKLSGYPGLRAFELTLGKDLLPPAAGSSHRSRRLAIGLLHVASEL